MALRDFSLGRDNIKSVTEEQRALTEQTGPCRADLDSRLYEELVGVFTGVFFFFTATFCDMKQKEHGLMFLASL